MYVQTTLDVHKKYNALVMSAFNNDAGFVAALDKVSVPDSTGTDRDRTSLSRLIVASRPVFPQACGRFINNNAVTRMAQSSSKSPELLARYCDSLLKKRSEGSETHTCAQSSELRAQKCARIVLQRFRTNNQHDFITGSSTVAVVTV